MLKGVKINQEVARVCWRWCHPPPHLPLQERGAQETPLQLYSGERDVQRTSVLSERDCGHNICFLTAGLATGAILPPMSRCGLSLQHCPHLCKSPILSLIREAFAGVCIASHRTHLLGAIFVLR